MSSTTVMVSVAEVDPDPEQPRTAFDDSSIEDLAESVRIHGIIQPLVVRLVGNRTQIVCGERRWRAAKVAGLTEVPAIVRELDDERAFSESLAENIARESLSPVDEVRAVARLAERHGVQDAARRLGKPHSWVSKRKRIAEGPGFVVDFLSTGASGDIEAHYELAKLAERDADTAKTIIENHAAGGHLREEIKSAAEDLADDVEHDSNHTRSHANGSEDEFRIESREAAAAEADSDADDADRYEGGSEASEPTWRPSDAPELDAPFEEPPLLVTAVEARRAGQFMLSTSDGTTMIYEFSESARVQLRALVGTG